MKLAHIKLYIFILLQFSAFWHEICSCGLHSLYLWTLYWVHFFSPSPAWPKSADQRSASFASYSVCRGGL